MKREWIRFEPWEKRCDLCSHLAHFSHPAGGFRCRDCPRPGANGKDERSTRPRRTTPELRHPISGKRWRSTYNGGVYVPADMHRQLQRHCAARGLSMRNTLDAAITAKLDELERQSKEAS